jgi:predicted outer membrane protein
LAVLLISLPQNVLADDTDRVLRDVHELNWIVIKAASLAQRKATREEVRAYGRRLEMDHRFADYRVLELASDLGIEISKPVTTRERTDEEKEQSHFVDRLAELESISSGPEFERAFVRMMRAVHSHAIDGLSSALRRSAPSLVRMLDRMIPIFEQHVELAVNLSGSSEAHAER